MFAAFRSSRLATLDSLVKRCQTNLRQYSSDTQYHNPIDYLNQYSQVPILSETQHVYKPTSEEIAQAQKYFMPPSKQDFTPWRGKVKVDDLPVTTTPEVAFLGRSNVGKSSLISQLLFHETRKIKISAKPGRTKANHLYQIADHFGLVDMPGYGENMPEYYADCVESYLGGRKNLMRAFLLIDLATGISSIDKVGLEMMESVGVPYAIVLTKLDLRTTGEQLRGVYAVAKFIQNNLTGCLPQPFVVSAHTERGLDFLRAFICHVTHCSEKNTTGLSKRPIS